MRRFLKALQRQRSASRVALQTFQLVPPLRWDMGVGVEGKTGDAGTAGARSARGLQPSG